MNKPMTVVHLQWTGPFDWEKKDKLNSGTDYGVYQVYGCHSVYGVDTLLYIGTLHSSITAAVTHYLKGKPWHEMKKWGSYLNIQHLRTKSPSVARPWI